MLLDPYRFAISGPVDPDLLVTLQDHSIDIHGDMSDFGEIGSPAEAVCNISFFGWSPETLDTGGGLRIDTTGDVDLSPTGFVEIDGVVQAEPWFDFVDEWVASEYQSNQIRDRTFDVSCSCAEYPIDDSWVTLDDGEHGFSVFVPDGLVNAPPTNATLEIAIRNSTTLNVVKTATFSLTFHWDNNIGG